MNTDDRLIPARDIFPEIGFATLIGIFLFILAATGFMRLEISAWVLVAAGLIFAQIVMPAIEAPNEAGNGESGPDPAQHSPRPGSGRACPRCGWRDVRRSMPQGVLDAVVRVLGLVPYRCRTCGARFYRGRPAQ